jgi:hypothetical protein
VSGVSVEQKSIKRENDTACFELESYRDLYEKARHDFDKLNTEVNSYDLFNFLCTIHHLSDWVKALLRAKDLAKDLKFPKILEESKELEIIRDLCNRAKHFNKDRNSVVKETSSQQGYGMGRYGMGEYGVGEPSYTVTVDGQKLDVLELCREALGIWENWINSDNKDT